MERIVDYVRKSAELKDGACQLLKRLIALAQFLMTRKETERLERGAEKRTTRKMQHVAESD